MNFSVQQLINDRNNGAMNQIVFDKLNDNGSSIEKYFISYGVKIFKSSGNKYYISSEWNYSKTTKKHLYIFLRDFFNMEVYGQKDILDNIKNGTFILVDKVN